MAILRGAIKKMTGSAGEFMFHSESGRTIVREKPASVKNVRSVAQQRTRMKFTNIIRMYKAISPLAICGFEDKAKGVSDYNMFVKVNMYRTPVFLTKAEVADRACVAAPYKITDGSLDKIFVTGKGANAVTNIDLGGLVIDANTTVGEFSSVVVSLNTDYDKYDLLSFYSVLQYVDEETGTPFVKANACSIKLDPKNQAPLWTLVNKAGFASKNGFLAHGENEGDGVFCWVHSRKKGDGSLLVSSQCLIDNNTILADYTSEDAYYDAVNTYGGERNVFLDPTTSGNAARPSSSDNGGTSGGNGGSTPAPNPSSGDDNTGGSF
ncbi:MAG: hypothetical protein J6Y15_10150 [Bacteroidaceae bacterium]|nr:hypothetical protein [Bacteroidaceae bacterium]